MIRFAGLLCLLLSVLTGPALAGTCVVPYIRTLDNQTVNGTMYVVSGKRCSIALQRSAGPIHSVKLVSRPSNGSVSINGGQVVYVSSAGYVGDDHFTYARQGLNALNQPITRTVEVTVKVSARL
ncbi:Ig-like domain-containing protein [Bradyrhizobium sp. UFLA05-153]